jgi:Tfp pilus assembly protein PilF
MIFWAIRGYAAEGLWWYEQILNLPSVPAATESRVLNAAGLMLYTQGDLGRARNALSRAVALGRGVGDAGVVAQAENMLGHVGTASAT